MQRNVCMQKEIKIRKIQNPEKGCIRGKYVYSVISACRKKSRFEKL